VGSSGAILSYIMCKGMNATSSRSFSGFGGEWRSGGRPGAASGQARFGGRRRLHHEERAEVIIVPGYGMAVAQAQHALREWPIISRRKASK